MKIITLLSFCFLLNVNANSQISQSQAILNKLSGSMKSLKTFYVEFNANIKNTSTGVNESEKGKGSTFIIKLPLLYGTYPLFTL